MKYEFFPNYPLNASSYLHICHHEDLVEVIIHDLDWKWFFPASNPEVGPVVLRQTLHFSKAVVSTKSFTTLFVKYQAELELWIEASKFGYKKRNVHAEDRRHMFSNNV